MGCIRQKFQVMGGEICDRYPVSSLNQLSICVSFNFFIRLAVYIIANLELIVRSYPSSKKMKCIQFLRRFQIYSNRSIIQPGENDWGFGQIIAVILTLGIFIDIVTAIREWDRMKHHPLKNSED